MPLSSSQRDFIKGAIGHLIDFPNQSDLFIVEVTKLVQALNEDIETDHEYFTLKQCLLNPCNFLLRLEESNDIAITVGEVQENIFDMIDSSLRIVANAHNISLIDQLWDCEHFKAKFITEEAHSTPFVTLKPATESTPVSWEYIHRDDEIFYASLAATEENELELTFHVDIPHNPINRSIIMLDELPEEMDEDEFMEFQIDEAYEIALDNTKTIILDYIEENKLLSPSILDEFKKNSPLQRLLVDKFYFNQILNKKLSIEFTTHLNNNEINNLLNPAAKNFLRHWPQLFNAVTKLNPCGLKILNHYGTLFNNGKIDFYSLKYLSIATEKMLLHPVIVNAIHQGRLSFELAKQLPQYCSGLLNSDLYMEYEIFSKPEFRWKEMLLITQSSCDFLLDKSVAKLVRNGILEMEEVEYLPNQQRILEFLKFENILDLLLKKLITPRDVAFMAANMLQHMSYYPYLNQWLSNNLIQLEDIKINDINKIYNKVYTQRLYAICQKKPFQFKLESKQITDSLEDILFELSHIATIEKLELPALQNQIVSHFLFYFVRQLAFAATTDPLSMLTNLLAIGKSLPLPAMGSADFRLFSPMVTIPVHADSLSSLPQRLG